MAETDLDYAKVTGRFGLVVADADDVGDNPDIIWCDEGEIDLIPLVAITKVADGSPVPWEGGQGKFTAVISGHDYVDPTGGLRDGAGHLTYRGKPFMMVVDLTSPKVNPRIEGSGLATHQVVFRNLRAGGVRVDFPSRPVRITTDGPGGDGVNDLVTLLPVVTGAATPITIGPRGASVVSADIVDDVELVLGLSDGSVVSAGDLPAATTAIDAAGAATAAAAAAETASSSAATARTGAESARDAAVTAKGQAETARGGAETARSGAQAALSDAEDARDAAASSASTATTKAGEASASASAAGAAKSDAETARGQAQGYAAAASTSASEAAGSAASIVGAVDDAQTAAATATTKAGEASASATAAAGSAADAHQSALDAAQSAAEAAAGGVQKVNGKSPDGSGEVVLSASDITTGTLPSSVLPPLAVTKVSIVASQAAMLALTAEEGDVAKRTDTGRTYFLAASPASTLANWVEVTASGDVVSVAGKTGAVTLGPSDVGARPAGDVPWGEVSGKPTTFAPSAHTHDDQYYTEAEVDSALAGNSSGDRNRANHTGTQPASTITGLGTAATQDASAFATAAQGTKADTAVQPGDLGNSASRNVGTGSGDVAAGNLGVPASGTTGHVLTKTSGGFGWAAAAAGASAAELLLIGGSINPDLITTATANVGAALDILRQMDGLASSPTLAGCATLAAVMASSTAKAAAKESPSVLLLVPSLDPLYGVNIGDPFMGGFFAGIIDTTKGNIIAADASQTGLRYALIVAPKSLESASLQYKTANSAAPAAASTRWDGLTATAAMNSATYPAAQWCAGRTKPSGDDASEWYLPAMDELELIYRNLKATTENNYTIATTGSTFPGGTQNQGYNPSSDPAGTAYSSSVPAQTTVAAFKTGGAEALGTQGSDYWYWSATEYSASYAWQQNQSGSSSGYQYGNTKNGSTRVRPVRRLVL